MHRLRVIVALVAFSATVGCHSGHSNQPPVDTALAVSPTPMSVEPTVDPLVDSLRAEIQAAAGDSPYIVIDRSRNRLTLRTESDVALDAVCATGSGKILFGEKNNQTWHFKTPKRVFTVRKKVTDPIWKKPVWAFVEKNVSAPVLPWEFRRLDGTTLGAYALELENSYAIHGTLYPSLLGRSITHGCIRLNAEDLAYLYESSAPGTKVYVF